MHATHILGYRTVTWLQVILLPVCTLLVSHHHKGAYMYDTTHYVLIQSLLGMILEDVLAIKGPHSCVKLRAHGTTCIACGISI